MSARLMTIHCLSPLHAGTGQSLGAVDLPIAREVSTGLPYLPSTSIKGSLRDLAFGMKLGAATRMFGQPTKNDSDHAAGALSFGDGLLLCLPVRSVYGTFAWATSPMLLLRLVRDAHEAQLSVPVTLSDLQINGIEHAWITTESWLSDSDQLIFEDLNFTSQKDSQVDTLAQWIAELFFEDHARQSMFCSRFVILYDDAMSFLARHAVDIVTRVSIDAETKTVKDGQLWTEENLPMESLLISLVADIPVLARRIDGNVFDHLGQVCAGTVQFGGNATVGRGRTRVRLRGGAR